MASWALRFSKPLVRDPLLFDLSRLLSRAHRTTPTGIDRVELAWAQHLIEFAPERLVFTAINAFGRIGILSTSPAVLFVAAVARVWSGAPAPHAADEPVALALRLQVALAVGGDRAIARRVAAMVGRSTYILVSHHHLEKSESIHRLLTQTGARFLTLVHDVIPLALPEYARKGTPQVHLRRIETVARSADVVVTNSVGGRRNPFLPWAGLDLLGMMGLADHQATLAWWLMDRLQAAKLAHNVWKAEADRSAFDPSFR